MTFTPLITKKLKASDITVGSFGTSSSVEAVRNVTKEDCDELNAVYVPRGINVEKPLCVMKYNAGDGYCNDDWTGVQKCIAGSSCTVQNGSSETVTKENLQPTCRVGTTGGTGGNFDFGGYSGCIRTLCNPELKIVTLNPFRHQTASGQCNMPRTCRFVFLKISRHKADI